MFCELDWRWGSGVDVGGGLVCGELVFGCWLYPLWCRVSGVLSADLWL